MNLNSRGQERQERVFESTAGDSIVDYAGKMEASLTPSGIEWLKLEAGSDIPEESKLAIDTQLESATTILFNHLNSSNFSSQIQESYLDLAISTGAIIVEEGDGIQSSLNFRSVSLANLILERSSKGVIDTVWQRIIISARDLLVMFPHTEPKLTDTLRKLIIDKPNSNIELIEGVQLNSNNKTYSSVILYESEGIFLYNEEVISSPWIVFRENTSPDETYGRGRAIRALPDVKTLNKVMQYYIESCELNGQPIYLAVDDGIINPSTIKIRPKSVIPVSDTSDIAALPMAGRPELNIDLMQRLQSSIRTTMLSKPFGQIDETPVRTATEMSIRNADSHQAQTVASGRVQSELLERLIARCVYVLKTLGKLPDIKVNGKEVLIKFTSPSARRQDELEIGTLMRFVEVMQTLPPELVEATIKVEEFPAFLADKLGVSKTLVRSISERETLQQQQMEARQQQMEATNVSQQ